MNPKILHRVDISIVRAQCPGTTTAQAAGCFSVATILALRALETLLAGDILVITPVLSETPALPAHPIPSEALRIEPETTKRDLREQISGLFNHYGKECR